MPDAKPHFPPGPDSEKQTSAARLLPKECWKKFLEDKRVASRREAERQRLLSELESARDRRRDLSEERARFQQHLDGQRKPNKQDLEHAKALDKDIEEIGEIVSELLEARKSPKRTADDIARAGRCNQFAGAPWHQQIPAYAAKNKLVYAPAKVTLSGQTALSAALENRVEQVKVIDRLRTITRTSKSRAELKADVRRDVARLAAKGVPDIKRGFRWPSGSFSGNDGERTAAQIAWLLMPQLIEKLDAEIDSRPEGMSTTRRAQKISDLEAELLRLQRIEERLVSICFEKGYEIERLPNRHPLAWLELELVPLTKAK